MVGSYVEVLSKEMIKPSSPTPHHLRNLKLSFLDQIAPPVYVPLIFFYQTEIGQSIDHAQKSQSLKLSLSGTLTHFYPLAGMIKNDGTIDCNDAGVEFIEAQVHSHLSQVIEKPDVEELKKYLPIDPYGTRAEMAKEPLLSIQINFFDYGGMAIGVCISHNIADGLSLVTFINAWAATSRGASKLVRPNFDLACHFPPRDSLGFMPMASVTKEKIVTRRFIFDKMRLATLKEVASSPFGSEVKDPTRVEAVSAFIWWQFMKVSKVKLDTKKMFAAVHAVNMRPQMKPPLPDHSFGNVWTYATALSTSKGKQDYHDLVSLLRGAIRKIDVDHVKKVQNGDWYMKDLKRVKENLCKGDLEFCNFSSWCRFPMYEVDYGWGKPVWVCTTTMPFKNLVILMSTSCGEGIEAWVSMVEDDMAMFEHDHLSVHATKMDS
ncbi:stemmadenine O-acetyltransferase-like [Cornus florida]|uniref:stemmadenine O-acetyltransferase-like n=1 Tax=Cornus florida TaxID=4283 RepID=UPI0028967DDB|nr:stemmadenine O-acetyltransferase-like [Cornus florida]